MATMSCGLTEDLVVFAVDAAATELEIRGPGALDVETPSSSTWIGAPTSVPAPSTKVLFTT